MHSRAACAGRRMCFAAAWGQGRHPRRSNGRSIALEGVQMKSFVSIAVMAACLLAGPAVFAQQASAPAGSTGQCKDGSYTDHATKKGACSGHKGVKEWYAAAAAAAAA